MEYSLFVGLVKSTMWAHHFLSGVFSLSSVGSQLMDDASWLDLDLNPDFNLDPAPLISWTPPRPTGRMLLEPAWRLPKAALSTTSWSAPHSGGGSGEDVERSRVGPGHGEW
jgi:hypothetical protein